MRKKRLEARARVIAKACVDGAVTGIETCHKLSPYTYWLKEQFLAEEATLINGICSETDALPVGALEDDWHPDFIAPKLAALAAYEVLMNKHVVALCKAFLVRQQASPEFVEES